MVELVLPNDTNYLNNLMGGKLLHWMDIAAAISAQRHAESVVVTASVDNVSFQQPIGLGFTVTLEAKVTRAFSTSMEVRIEVWAENIPEKIRFRSHSAFYTFVAVDKQGRPVQVPEVAPETEEEELLYQGALRRRQLRLILAKRMDPSEATELKSLFD
ncbi:MAG: acyl-CoA thioesterase [Cytophagales bacterium]|nr:acyl-CoA thioesterase [Cytophagales bacterium]